MMNVSEIFYSIQGEGPSVGKPCIFIRLQGCNLKCSWCDTKYASYEIDKLNPMSFSEILETVEIIVDENIEAMDVINFVFTGGEPLIHNNLQYLINLLGEYFYDKKHMIYVEVETNGTIDPSDYIADVNQFNVSPKLSNSSNPIKKRLKNKSMIIHSKLSKESNNIGDTKSYFKFVISQEKDADEIWKLMRKYDIDTQVIYLMPEGKNQEELNRTTEMTLQLCKKYGFRFCDRLHVKIWNGTRGV